MNRITRPSRNRRRALLGTAALLAATSASVAAADDGPGPLGVTAQIDATRESARVGAIFSGRGDLGGGHFCTASVVHSKGRNLIVTAAHCVSGGGDMVFVPGYRDGETPYGIWRVKKTYFDDKWTKTQDEDSDLAFAVLGNLGGNGVEDVVGANKLVTGRETGATAVTVTGYPRDVDTPISCTNKPTVHSHTQQRIDCPGFTGGTSGSPWVNGDGEVVGLIGGHEEGGSTADISYSVVLGQEVADLYRTATLTKG